MIHGIHAGRDRVSWVQVARDPTSRGGIQLLDLRRMDFPGKLNNCETCHVTATGTTATYNVVPAARWRPPMSRSTARPTAACRVFLKIRKKNWRHSPRPPRRPWQRPRSPANATDNVSTPLAGACVSCHDNSAAKAHIAINGGQLNVTRCAALPAGRALEDVESCAVCHGPGSAFDTAKVHK